MYLVPPEGRRFFWSFFFNGKFGGKFGSKFGGKIRGFPNQEKKGLDGIAAMPYGSSWPVETIYPQITLLVGIVSLTLSGFGSDQLFF